MKRVVVTLAMHGLLGFGWYRRFGTWLLRVTGSQPT